MLDEPFASTPGEWLAPDGPDNDIVISTRVRLARNIRGYRMPWRLADEERSELEAHLRTQIMSSGIVEDSRYWNVDGLSSTERQLLVERHLISRELAQGKGDRGVVFTSSESVSIMTNEEDHLGLQVIRCGLQLAEAWKLIDTIDDAMEQLLPYAVSPRLGYLTACPTNVGTGLRFSVMTHLPTLAQTKQISKVHNAAAKVGLVLRGLYGEGTEAQGDLYQISNQVTLGRSEEEIMREVQTMACKVVEWERGVRELLLEQDRLALEDRIWRAWGALRFARKISSLETMQHLSSIRLGLHTKILLDVSPGTLNELFLFTQPAHLQVLRRIPLEARERDTVRAKFIRDLLNAGSS